MIPKQTLSGFRHDPPVNNKFRGPEVASKGHLLVLYIDAAYSAPRSLSHDFQRDFFQYIPSHPSRQYENRAAHTPNRTSLQIKLKSQDLHKPEALFKVRLPDFQSVPGWRLPACLVTACPALPCPAPPCPLPSALCSALCLSASLPSAPLLCPSVGSCLRRRRRIWQKHGLA